MILLEITLLALKIMDSGLTRRTILQDLQQVLMFVPKEVKQDYLLITQLIQQEDMDLEFFMK
jgi:hypothetical protein